MKKILFVLLILLMAMTCQTVLADPPDAKEVDEIQLRDPLQLERAAMAYILSYEAYTTARKSKNPEIRKRLIKLMQEYRNAYARFLEMLRSDKLYKPNKPKDPAGWYDEKYKKTKGFKRKWKETDAKELRAEVKDLVKKGASPEDVRAFIQTKLPLASLSSDPVICTPAGFGDPTNSNTASGVGNRSGGDDDDDDDDDDEKENEKATLGGAGPKVNEKF